MRAQTPSLSLLALVTVILLAVPKETYAQYIDECYYECNIVHCNYYGYCDYDCYEVCYPYRSNSNSSPIKQPRAPPRMQTSSARKNIETSPSSPSSPSYSIIRGNHQPARHQQSSSLTNGAESHIQQVRTGKVVHMKIQRHRQQTRHADASRMPDAFALFQNCLSDRKQFTEMKQ